MSETNGTRLIDKLVGLTPTERRKFHFAAADETLYFKTLTKAEMEAAIPQDGVERPRSTIGLLLLCHVCEYEDGSKVFKREDIERLRTKVGAQLVTQLEDFMWDTQLPPIKEAEKAIDANPTSASA